MLGATSSLASLLAEQRGVRNRKRLPRLSHEQILTWADRHHARTGRWPTRTSGPVTDAPGEHWRAVAVAMTQGIRGLVSRTSLAQLLDAQRGVRNEKSLPPLRIRTILAWADAHHRRTGQWPTLKAGVIQGADGQTWSGVDSALRGAERGVRRRASLAQLLARHRGLRNPKGLGPLTEAQILEWADAYHRRTGRWPQVASGLIAAAGGQTWTGVEVALQHGKRGLPGKSSLARLLAARRGVPIRGRLREDEKQNTGTCLR
ncbi:MAG TPA: hypothetical protein VGM03_21750 [Phycisphaerae bacterium]|jgi:hypothetical protein